MRRSVPTQRACLIIGIYLSRLTRLSRLSRQVLDRPPNSTLKLLQHSSVTG